MRIRLTDELAGKVEALYRQHLKQYFGDKFKFDPIIVEPTEDSEGLPTFRVTVFYDDEGDEDKNPDPRTKLDVLVSLTDPLDELGLQPVMIESYVPVSEYSIWLDLRENPPPWEEQEDWDRADDEWGE